jgi:hypothetical protein
MLRNVSVDDAEIVTITQRVFGGHSTTYRGPMTTSTSTDSIRANHRSPQQEDALQRLARLRSDLRVRELDYVDTRAKLLLAYRQARREGFTDNDLSGSAGTLRSILERSL